MLLHERQEIILDLLEQTGSVQTVDLVRHFGVSDETIRKDLDALAQRGRLLRIHGGATRLSNIRHDLPLPERTAMHRAEKARIARQAAQLIEPRDTIFLDASSTVLAMTDYINPAHGDPLTLLTNAHHVIVAMSGKANCNLICTGGQYEERSRSYVGPGAEEALRRYLIRMMFVGVDGLHPQHGASELNPGQAILKERIIDRAEKLCVVTHHSKLGKTTPFLFASVSRIDVLVTDDQTPRDMLRRFEDAGVQIILAPMA